MVELSKILCAEISWFDLNGDRLFKVIELDDSVPKALTTATEMAANYVRFFTAPRVVTAEGKLEIDEPASMSPRAFVLAEIHTPRELAQKLRGYQANPAVPHDQVLERLAKTIGLPHVEYAQSLEDVAMLCEAQPASTRFVGGQRGFFKMEKDDIAFNRQLKMVWPLPPSPPKNRPKPGF